MKSLEAKDFGEGFATEEGIKDISIAMFLEGIETTQV